MDRRVIWAIVLMMLIAIVPAVFIKKPADGRAGGRADSTAVAARDSAARAAAPAPPQAPPQPARAIDTTAPADSSAGADTVLVTSDLYSYGFSTRGGRLVLAELPKYRSMAPGEERGPVELLPPGTGLLGLTLVNGRDTIPLDDWTFTPSTRRLDAHGRPVSLTMTSQRGPVGVEVTYSFRPDDYRIGVRGRVTGLGPNGGLLHVGLGSGLRNTEADSNDNYRAYAIVTKAHKAERTDFSKLEPGRTTTLSGPFDWVAVKSKYFVTGAIIADSTQRISGVTATPRPTGGKHTTQADVTLTLPVPAAGDFGYTVYAGPMEYPRLSALGYGFDDVNPYGWPGFRTLIRFFAVPVRFLLVWMHENLYLAYGVVLIVFGILVRLLLWPLNQKAMRASMQMQAIQPELKRLQEQHKEDPQRLQQEMFKLYKEHNVNPLGGCWPMLLPMPVLIALFFVFQNSIELRGASFLWLPDLAQKDPYFIIPVIMGVSMYFLSKVGQMGMEPNPQMKMMLYIMPVMMTVLFVNFPAGLNLYYAVSNIASIPQQWLLARERKRRNARAVMEVGTRMPAKEVDRVERKARRRQR